MCTDGATVRSWRVARQGLATKRAAEKAMQAVLQSIEDGTVVQRSKMTVAEFLDDWSAGSGTVSGRPPSPATRPRRSASDRHGHATVGITLDLYSHVTPAIAREAADVVASRIFDG